MELLYRDYIGRSVSDYVGCSKILLQRHTAGGFHLMADGIPFSFLAFDMKCVDLISCSYFLSSIYTYNKIAKGRVMGVVSDLEHTTQHTFVLH